MSPHLLIEGSQQDVAQHRRNDTPLRGSLRRFKPPALVFVACLERLLNKLQHSAVGDLLSNQRQEFVVIDRPEIIFQIRVYDPLVPSLYFAPDLGQRIGCLSTLPIPKTTGNYQSV